MKNFNINLGLLIGIFILVILMSFRTCSTQRRIERILVPEIEVIKENVSNNPTAEELKLIIEIIGYDISYRMLYDNNTIVRTTKRPDDVMNEYIERKKQLERELRNLRDNK